MFTCWDKEPSNRPSFQQIIRLLDEIREGQTVSLILMFSASDSLKKYVKDENLISPSHTRVVAYM